MYPSFTHVRALVRKPINFVLLYTLLYCQDTSYESFCGVSRMLHKGIGYEYFLLSSLSHYLNTILVFYSTANCISTYLMNN
jgi:hypothetical protein